MLTVGCAEEMSLAGSAGSCDEDYLQFGRDILFVTSHRDLIVHNDNNP